MSQKKNLNEASKEELIAIVKQLHGRQQQLQQQLSSSPAAASNGGSQSSALNASLREEYEQRIRGLSQQVQLTQQELSECKKKLTQSQSDNKQLREKSRADEDTIQALITQIEEVSTSPPSAVSASSPNNTSSGAEASGGGGRIAVPSSSSTTAHGGSGSSSGSTAELQQHWAQVESTYQAELSAYRDQVVTLTADVTELRETLQLFHFSMPQGRQTQQDSSSRRVELELPSETHEAAAVVVEVQKVVEDDALLWRTRCEQYAEEIGYLKRTLAAETSAFRQQQLSKECAELRTLCIGLQKALAVAKQRDAESRSFLHMPAENAASASAATAGSNLASSSSPIAARRTSLIHSESPLPRVESAPSMVAPAATTSLVGSRGVVTHVGRPSPPHSAALSTSSSHHRILERSSHRSAGSGLVAAQEDHKHSTNTANSTGSFSTSSSAVALQLPSRPVLDLEPLITIRHPTPRERQLLLRIHQHEQYLTLLQSFEAHRDDELRTKEGIRHSLFVQLQEKLHRLENERKENVEMNAAANREGEHGRVQDATAAVGAVPTDQKPLLPLQQVSAIEDQHQRNLAKENTAQVAAEVVEGERGASLQLERGGWTSGKERPQTTIYHPQVSTTSHPRDAETQCDAIETASLPPPTASTSFPVVESTPNDASHQAAIRELTEANENLQFRSLELEVELQNAMTVQTELSNENRRLLATNERLEMSLSALQAVREQQDHDRRTERRELQQIIELMQTKHEAMQQQLLQCKPEEGARPEEEGGVGSARLESLLAHATASLQAVLLASKDRNQAVLGDDSAEVDSEMILNGIRTEETNDESCWSMQQIRHAFLEYCREDQQVPNTTRLCRRAVRDQHSKNDGDTDVRAGEREQEEKEEQDGKEEGGSAALLSPFSTASEGKMAPQLRSPADVVSAATAAPPQKESTKPLLCEPTVVEMSVEGGSAVAGREEDGNGGSNEPPPFSDVERSSFPPPSAALPLQQQQWQQSLRNAADTEEEEQLQQQQAAQQRVLSSSSMEDARPESLPPPAEEDEEDEDWLRRSVAQTETGPSGEDRVPVHQVPQEQNIVLETKDGTPVDDDNAKSAAEDGKGRSSPSSSPLPARTTSTGLEDDKNDDGFEDEAASFFASFPSHGASAPISSAALSPFASQPPPPAAAAAEGSSRVLRDSSSAAIDDFFGGGGQGSSVQVDNNEQAAPQKAPPTQSFLDDFFGPSSPPAASAVAKTKTEGQPAVSFFDPFQQ